MAGEGDVVDLVVSSVGFAGISETAALVVCALKFGCPECGWCSVAGETE